MIAETRSLLFDEWQKSQVDKALTEANVVPLVDSGAWPWLMVSPKLERINNGRLSGPVLKKYRFLDYTGGWVVPNRNPLTGELTDYCQFKAFNPRRDKDGDPIKYEGPPKVPTEVMFLLVVPVIWDRVAKRYGLEPPDMTKGTFWQWVLDHPEIPIWIVEGVKKAAALLSVGIVAVSAPGVWNCYDQDLSVKESKGYVIDKFLKPFCKDRGIVIGFDQDSKPKTVKSVRNARNRLGKVLQDAGSVVKIALWKPDQGKGIDDYLANGYLIDDVEVKSWGSVKHGEYVESLTGLTHPINHLLNQRFLGNLDLPTHKINAIKAPKGTGKTVTMSNWCKMFQDLGYKVLVLGHRQQLVSKQCDDFGVVYIDSMVNDEYVRFEGRHFGYGCCIDSLSKNSRVPFNIDKFIDPDRPLVLFIDETDQVLLHSTIGQTEIKNRRVEVLQNLTALIKAAKHIIIGSADLSSVEIDFLAKTAETDDIHLTVNSYQGENNYTAYCYNQNNPSILVRDMLDNLLTGKHFVCLQGQKASSKYGTKAMYQLIKRKYPDKKILVIDAETIADPTHPAYLAISRLDELINNYDVFLVSPTLETGISIEARHKFTAVWGIFTGVTSTETVRQSLSRVRDNCPRYIFVQKKGQNKIGDGSYNIKMLLTGNNATFKANRELLARASYNENILENNSLWVNLWSKQVARHNYGKDNYRLTIYDGLIKEGNNIIIVDDATKEEIQENTQIIKDNSVECYERELDMMADIPSSNSDRLKELEAKQDKDPLERLEEKKLLTEKKYQTRWNKNLQKLDDKGLYKKLRLYYYLTLGRSSVSNRDKAVMEKLNLNRMVFSPDVNRSLLGVAIFVLDWIGITDLLSDKDTEYCQDSPIIQDIAKKALTVNREIKLVLNVTITEKMTPIQIIQTLLSSIGMRLKSLENRRVGKGKRVRFYGSPIFTFNDEDNQLSYILSRWLGSEKTA